MKPTAIIMTFSLASVLAMDACATGSPAQNVPWSQVSVFAADLPVRQLALLGEGELSALREQWRDLAPEEREKLRRKLRDEHGVGIEDGFGMGFESRRRDSDDTTSSDPEGEHRFGKPRGGERVRELRKGRR